MIGLVLLTVCADLMVRGAVAIARRTGLSSLIIGLTVVAIGTSAPELVTSMAAALDDAPDIAVGNIVGSNLANMLLILGVAAAIRAVRCETRVVLRDGSAVMIATVAFVGFALTGRFDWISGVVLLAGLSAYLIYSYRAEKHGEGATLLAHEAEDVADVPESAWKAAAFLLAGLAGTIGGAKLLVSGAVGIATAMGVSQAVIGLTLVALGTSLPELAIVIVASLRGHGDVALGNVLGSNIFNLLGIVGVVAVVTPLEVSQELLSFDIWVLLGVTAVLLPMMLTGRRINRLEGWVLIAGYLAFLAIQFGSASPAA